MSKNVTNWVNLLGDFYYNIYKFLFLQVFLRLEGKQCRNFGHIEKSHRRFSEQIKLTVTHFHILNWQKKVKRQGWNFIFQKKKKGLNPSELFASCFVVVSYFYYICPLQNQSRNRKRQINHKVGKKWKRREKDQRQPKRLQHFLFWQEKKLPHERSVIENKDTFISCLGRKK